MFNTSGSPASTGPDFTPALLSAMLHATADNLDRTPIAIVVEDALRLAFSRGQSGASALNEVTWALRGTADVVDNLPPLA